MSEEEKNRLDIRNQGGEDDSVFDGHDQGDSDNFGGGSSKGKGDNKKSKTPVLDNFGRDLTKLAEEGKIDSVIGRDKEIDRVSQILSRRKKNNPILIGEPGVGKSAIAEGLAIRIHQKKVSRVLFNKRIVSVDLAALVAGTKYRGQFEERLKALINEINNNDEVIIFLDEIHTIVGAGGSSGSLDAANMIKPALARGELQCIGATTLNEYREHIEKDGALERRFQKVVVDPTSEEDTLEILNSIKEIYENHHNVTYTEEAIKACVKLTSRYVTDRNHPDKAIDALDESGSKVNITNIVVPKIITDLEESLERISEEKIKTVKKQKYEDAAKLRDQEKEVKSQLEEHTSLWEEELKKNRKIVDEHDVAKVVSMVTGVPVDKVSTKESKSLQKMGDVMRSKVIGQDKAVDKVVKAIKRNRSGLKDPNRPVGSFIFLGPTGVGKTQLCKVLAQSMYEGRDSLVRIDMSEYMEKFAISRLIGSPPGYVGHDEGGELTEAIRRKPYSIILFDEIEKAHPDVFNLLLQVLDEGHLTDSIGRKVDFKNTIIIMTSNIGVRNLKDFGTGVGFQTTVKSSTEDVVTKGIIEKAMKKAFSPEFLNRVDDVIVFDSLDRKDLDQIVRIEVGHLVKRLESLDFTVNITEEAIGFISEKGHDPEYGARPLKRAIQKYVEDPVAECIIDNPGKENGIVTISFDQNDEELTINIEFPEEVEEKTDNQ